MNKAHEEGTSEVGVGAETCAGPTASRQNGIAGLASTGFVDPVELGFGFAPGGDGFAGSFSHD